MGREWCVGITVFILGTLIWWGLSKEVTFLLMPLLFSQVFPGVGDLFLYLSFYLTLLTTSFFFFSSFHDCSTFFCLPWLWTSPSWLSHILSLITSRSFYKQHSPVTKNLRVGAYHIILSDFNIIHVPWKCYLRNNSSINHRFPNFWFDELLYVWDKRLWERYLPQLLLLSSANAAYTNKNIISIELCLDIQLLWWVY